MVLDTGSYLVSEKEKKCQQLLRTSNYEQYKDRNPLPTVEGTCQWVLRHENYITWRDSKTSSLIWISANPGCGKSVLSRYLADIELQKTGNRTICYFFFKDDNEDQKTATNALCALLHQLFTHKPVLVSHAISTHDQNGDMFITYVYLLWDLFIRASEDPKAGEIICILDALDECRESELLYLLQQLCIFYKDRPHDSDKTALKFLVTSRPLQRIADSFNNLTKEKLTIRLTGEKETDQIKYEIDLVIRAELKELQQKWHIAQGTLEPLRKELSKVEHRTYLWLKLIFDLIRKDPQSIMRRGRQKIFGKIPDSVDAAYTNILNQSTDKEQAKTLLQIVCAAHRPLSVREMIIAIMIDPNDKRLDNLEIPSDNYATDLITNRCGLFVSVIDGRVYLLHQTAKEFLIGQNEIAQSVVASDWVWKHSLSDKGSNLVLANICMWYLRLGSEYDSSQKCEIVIGRPLSRYDFLDYAATAWSAHFREAAVPKDHSSTALALSLYNVQEYPYRAWWIDINKGDEISRTPLFWAVSEGQNAVIRQLLAAPGIDINKANKYGQTPLWEAACRGYTDIVRELLAAPEIDINKADNHGRTPLWEAACRGYTDIVRELLAAPEIDVNKADNHGRTPLWEVVCQGHIAFVEDLLATPGIDINKADEDSQTPLWWAVYEAQNAVVRQLLAAPGIDINKANKYGQTPLWWAVHEGYTAIINQLLAVPEIDIELGLGLARYKQSEHRRLGPDFVN
ncbi:Ankyrin repeat protein [Rutstroemia sp. NJR-2017a BBW]|nr:Ankyrin repeat protein [Rutstroemia sp. NJR-2017a BBW]